MSSLSINTTSGCDSRNQAVVPSPEAFSTTMISIGSFARHADNDSRQAPSASRER